MLVVGPMTAPRHALCDLTARVVRRDRNSVTDGESASKRPAGASQRTLPGGDVTVDEMSDASFPASDPPATWTWEVRATAEDADDSDDSGRRCR